MCKFYKKYENVEDEGMKCQWEYLFNSFKSIASKLHLKYKDLPHDSDGYCLLHSKQIKWKIESGFWERLIEIIGYLDVLKKRSKDEDKKEIRFYDCHIVGFYDDLLQLKEEYKLVSSSVKLQSTRVQK